MNTVASEIESGAKESCWTAMVVVGWALMTVETTTP